MSQSPGIFGKLSSLLQGAGTSATTKTSDRGEYELLSNTAGGHEDSVDQRYMDAQKQVNDSLARSAFAAGSSTSKALDLDAPTDLENATLRKVSDNLPWSAFLVAIVELCERFTFYGLSGAVGLGQTGATALVNFFVFFCNLTPVLGAIVADQFLGKYLAIYYFSIVYIVGVFILFLTSLPIAIENGLALGGLVVAMIVMGLGTGGIKSNVSPLIAEQYRNTSPFIRTLKSGERVIVDPAITIQRIYMVFYTCINVGSLSTLATTEMELNIGFWSAYLLCFLMFIGGFIILVLGKDQYVVRPPKGSVIPHALRICWIGLRHRSLDAAKPEYQDTNLDSRSRVPWDSVFVDEVRRALIACRVFLFYPIYWLVYSQMLSNFISQAGQMQLHGIPNDIMQNIDAITIIIFIPIMDRIVYPFLRTLGIPFKPITRIFMGFMFGTAAMIYAAGVQNVIYRSGPCYTTPRACDAALRPNGTYAPNNVHVALQTPAYLLIGLSEIFALVTGLEYAYTKAPTSMKSFIMSIYLLTNTFGSAFGIALSPFAVDPKLFWLYASLAVVCFITGLVFWASFKTLNDSEEELNKLEQHGNEPLPASGVNPIVRTREGDGKRDD